MLRYEARARQDDNGEWFVRLHRDGGECVGLCGANGPHEADCIAECVNAVVSWCDGKHDYPPEQAMKAIERLFDWSQYNKPAADADVCKRCARPSPNAVCERCHVDSILSGEEGR